MECETCGARVRNTHELATHCVNLDGLDEDD